MKLTPTRVTIQNTDSDLWLARLESTLSEHERLDVQLLVPRSHTSLAHSDRLVLQVLRDHIDRMLAIPPLSDAR